MAWLRLALFGITLSIGLAACGDDDFTSDGGSSAVLDLSVNADGSGATGDDGGEAPDGGETPDGG